MEPPLPVRSAMEQGWRGAGGRGAGRRHCSFAAARNYIIADRPARRFEVEDFELATVHYVAIGGFVLAAVFGFVANKTNFCTMGAVSDLLHMGSRGRLGAWFFAMGLAILGTQTLHAAGLVDLTGAIYLTPSFGWLGYVVGGIAFGVGMTLAAGCGQRNLVRFGGGSLKALVVLLVLGITAYTTVRGLLGLARITVFEAPNVDLDMHGFGDQGLATMLSPVLGVENTDTVRIVLAVLLGGGLIAFALAQATFRRSFDNLLAGIVIGAIITGGWFVTGYVGNDDFEPVPVESMTFIAPTGNVINYLMTFTGSTINFGIAAVLGMIAGSFLYAVTAGSFRIETFSTRSEMVSHLIGGLLMGFGGVLALGCTIGQGVTGMSTLAAGSLIAVACIIFGSAITMKVEYHMLDEKGFLAALGTGLKELAMPWRVTGEG